MRHFLSLALIFITGFSAVSAWAFPDKPVRIVIGFPAGGPLDQHARLLSERLQQVLGQAFKTVLSQPDIRRRMIEQGADPAFLGPEEFRQYLAQELPRWADAVGRSGARVD